MGTVVGAIAGGRVPVGNAAGDPVTSWLNPLSLLTGALFVATSAYLAAVFLVSDARRADDAGPRAVLHDRARSSPRWSPGRSRPSGLVALHSRRTLRLRRPDGRCAAARDPLGRLRASPCSSCFAGGARRGARVARGGRGRRGDLGLGRRAASVPAAAEPHDLRRGGPERDAETLLIVFGVAVLLVMPSLALLFTLVQRSLIEESRQAHTIRVRETQRRARPRRRHEPQRRRAESVLAALILVAAVANLNLAVANVALPDIGKASTPRRRRSTSSPSATRSGSPPRCSTSARSATATGAS